MPILQVSVTGTNSQFYVFDDGSQPLKYHNVKVNKSLPLVVCCFNNIIDRLAKYARALHRVDFY